MKILQITNKVPVPPKDGGSIASFRLAEGLINKGMQVHILAMNTSKHFISPTIIKTFEKPGLTIHPVWMNTKIKPVKALTNLLFSKMPFNAIRFISADFEIEIADSLKSFDPEIIILENLYPAVYIDLIRKLSPAKIIYRAHNVEHEIWERTASKSKGLRKWYLGLLAKRIKAFEYNVINKYDIVAPITQRDADSLLNMGNQKPCLVLPTGYKIKNSSLLPLALNSPKIAHLGALDWLPNQEGILWFMAEVWPLVKKINPDIEFHVAGRNCPAWLESKFSVPGVKFYGEIESADDFIKSNPVHIVPLLSGSGMRIKIVEAMANGRAVVTTSLGTEGIDTTNEKNILIADDEASFAACINKLINNEDYCREIGENAFTFVSEKLDNDYLVGSFIDSITKIT